MRSLGVQALAAGGWSRSALIAACTAITSGLLLVAVSMSRLGDSGTVNLMAPLADPGTRGGTVFGAVLLTLPVIALFSQGVRLGTTTRLRRYDALALAGATRRQLRGWAAIEVGTPAAIGSVLGIAVWWLLQRVLGRGFVDRGLHAIVPPDTGPGPWTALVVPLVAALGIFVGARSVRTLRTPRPARFPWWGVAAFIVGVFLLFRGAGQSSTDESEVLVFLALVAILVGVTSLAPWLTGLTARATAARARSGAVLLAARRLSLDPRPAARAALAAGAGGLVLGVLGGLMADLAGTSDTTNQEHYQAIRLVTVLTAVGFLFIGLALAVHIADTVVAERRAYAALSAVGLTTRTLLSALRWEALMATLPVALLGCLIGTLGYAMPVARGGQWIPWSTAALAATVFGVVAATLASSAVLAPVIRSATATGALRTE